MADPRVLFGERRLPEFLGGRRVDYYIPPEVRQGIGGLLAGLEAINPLTGLREYDRAMREGDYPSAASEALMLAAPGAGALVARGIGRAVPSAVRAADDAAEEGSVLLQETLSPAGAYQFEDPALEEAFQAWNRAQDEEAFALLEEAYDAGVPEPAYVEAPDTFGDGMPDGWVDADFADAEPRTAELPSATIFDTPEGGARFYSPALRAAGQLPQQVYGGLDELASAMRSRGAKPEELRLLEETLYERTELGPQASQRIFRDTAQQVADEYVTWVSPVVRRFTGNRTDYGDLFTKGGENYTEVAIGAPPAAGDIAPPYANRHFDLPSGTVAHYRAARFRTGGNEADAYHVGEVQSDWGQLRGKLPADEDAAELLRMELREAIEALRAAQTRYNNANAGPGSASDALNERILAEERVSRLSKKEDLYNQYGTREDFDAIYEGVPYVGSTDKWSQLALKQALIDAANSDARYMTLGTGDMAVAMTRGDLGGQRKFYDEILPKNLKKILQRLASDAGIKAPEIVPREIMVQQNRIMVPKMVPSIELTPELRRALSEVGLPSYRNGGLVSLLPM